MMRVCTGMDMGIAWQRRALDRFGLCYAKAVPAYEVLVAREYEHGG